MADTNVSAAVSFPEDNGTGVPDGSEDFNSAGYLGMLAQSVDSEYVASGLGFTVDTANDNVDLGAGHAFIEVTNVTVQSGSQETYDTTLPNPITAVVVIPSAVTGIPLNVDSVNDVYLAFPAGSNDGVYIRHGSAVSAPTDPHIKLGTVDTGSSGATTRPNDGAEVDERITRGSDGSLSGKTLEAGRTLVVEADESFVVSGSYTVNGDLTVNGSMTVM